MERRPSSRSAAITAGAAARLQQLADRFRSHRVVNRLWGILDDARGAARERLPEVSALGRHLAERILAEPASSRQTVINATGIIMPDGLELPWPLATAERVAQQACAATSCQADARKDPSSESWNAKGVQHILRQITGAEAALVLQNPAAALTAAIAALAAPGEVVAARSHIGLASRQRKLTIADVVAAAGARLREVGSIDRVSITDYQLPAGKPAGLILRAAPADYAIVGAGSEPSLNDLAALAQRQGLPLVDFLPAALLTEVPGLAWSGPIVGQSLAAGADLVVFDGQRCLGGPACGILVGRRELVERIAARPLFRLLAADPLDVAALEATLALAKDPASAEQSIPLWQLLTATADALRHRAQRLAPQLANCVQVARAEVIDGVAYLGPGQLPTQQFRDWCIAVEPAGGSAEQLAELLLGGKRSVWAAVERGQLVIHLRSFLARDDEQLAAAFNRLGTRTPVTLSVHSETSPRNLSAANHPDTSTTAVDESPVL